MPLYAQKFTRSYTRGPSLDETVQVFFETDEDPENMKHLKTIIWEALREQYPSWFEPSFGSIASQKGRARFSKPAPWGLPWKINP